MKNKKKKQLPLLLLALLFITTAAYGTRAYFSDDASQNANIKLTLGNLDIENEESEWVYNGEGNSTLDLTNGDEIDNASAVINVQPGDSFTRTFTFINNGSLDQNVTIDSNISEKKATVDNPFVVNVESSFTDTPVLLENGDKISFDVTITIPGDKTGGNFAEDGSYNVSGEVQSANPTKYSLDYLTKIIKVTAEQTNQ